ncbi:lipopolysaccharide-induced tumor necrosis factor-alpha factor homolog [Amyelois transitella]|uniref:lipopolysaccharide-induced tumor necrosis factor-alpha factor homolog n=1 Tax=Amyelois transitella TaxID=680683 RepID=UPI0029901F80|nr:lipopolysaccharide-induced tumor necrosis factor-alpha factor homolog [Amyelois transitella]
MNVSKVDNEESSSSLLNADYPGYPSLPPPYSPPEKKSGIPPNEGDGNTSSFYRPEDSGAEINRSNCNVVIVSAMPPVGPKSTKLTCPSCKATVSSKVSFKPTTKTHLIALLLCCCLCWPCVCVPYCVNSCRNANHYCPNCKAFLGTYQS